MDFMSREPGDKFDLGLGKICLRSFPLDFWALFQGLLAVSHSVSVMGSSKIIEW